MCIGHIGIFLQMSAGHKDQSMKPGAAGRSIRTIERSDCNAERELPAQAIA
jgi:hypothetical protein